MKKLVAGLGLGLMTTTGISTAALAATPSMEEMWELIQQQQAEIAELKAQLAATDEEMKETIVMAEATATMVEDGMAAGGRDDWASDTRLGGYAEMHYNNLEDDNTGSDKDEIDFHRYVLFVEHDFSEDTRFFSEVELEHSLSGDGQNGEVELEQAYIEHDLMDDMAMKAGLFLVPAGILNITHEPDTFFGVERNNVEKNIIPTTWWEGGLALTGEFAGGWNYEAQVTSGLKLDAQDGEFMIRDGRQKVSEADASDLAYTANLRYTGIAGLEVGATAQYQEDLYQGDFTDDVGAMLYTAHVAYRNGPFGLRALGAIWDIDDAINAIEEGADEQTGWYVEPSWMLTRDLGVFTRYSEWDNQAGSGSGNTDTGQWDLGLNYWLEENVVFKLDYQWQDADEDQKEYEGFNLGVGWSY
jgi:hypothetical protein